MLSLRLKVLTLAGVLLGLPSTAVGEAQRELLVSKLRHAEKAKERSDAANALGGPAEGEVVSALCNALRDETIVVRRAAALALGKTRNAEALECLRSRVGEDAAVVEDSIARSIRSLEASTGQFSRAPRNGDRLYVAVGDLTDKTGREDAVVGDIVRGAIQSKLSAAGVVSIAPSGEAITKARSTLKKYKLRGFVLKAVVERPEYGDAGLTATVRVTMWSYPDQALAGAFNPKVTFPDVKSVDAEAEEAVIEAAVERAVEAFLQISLSSR